MYYLKLALSLNKQSNGFALDEFMLKFSCSMCFFRHAKSHKNNNKKH